jgi:hypothetical protein
MKTKTSFLTSALILSVLTLSTYADENKEAPIFKEGTVGRCTDTKDVTSTPRYSSEQIKELLSAKEVVKKYWKSSYEEIYLLLSEEQKGILERDSGIRNGREYAKSFDASERVWFCQTYKKLVISNDSNTIEIEVLAQWEEEGYRGISTYIFTLVREKKLWVIDNILY